MSAKRGRLRAAFIALTSLGVGALPQPGLLHASGANSANNTALGLINLATGAHEPILAHALSATGAFGAPSGYRACFTTPFSQAMLTETFEIYENAAPPPAPPAFACFDADTIAHAITRGDAIAFLDTRNIHDGIDRVIAVFRDGRAYAWHQPNQKTTG